MPITYGKDSGRSKRYTCNKVPFTSKYPLIWERLFRFLLLCGPLLAQQEQPAPVPVPMRLDLAEIFGPLQIDHIALGQGGLSSDPIFADRVNEIRALHPRLIRLFLQEYFDVLPAPGRYHWDTLDASVDLIRKTGATPLMSIDFKPKVLFPKIDEKIVEPTSYGDWEQLIFEMVKHYKQRGSGIRYWEVANEPDIGENGGCPYLFTPEAYTRYYQHTVSAILRADPEARVGGPALANVKSSILQALIDSGEKNKVPLHFVSWHIYSSDPQKVRGTIDYVHDLLKTRPGMHVETILDEWNMALRDPPTDPRFQPAYLIETAYQMKQAGLDYSCYYHIHDYQIDPEVFSGFMSPRGVALMARWWNRSTQWDGLFDFNGRIRPSYFAFKLLARLTGNRLKMDTPEGPVHALATYDDRLRIYNVLVWNYSRNPAQAQITVANLPTEMVLRKVTLDAAAPSDDENIRLRPAHSQQLTLGTEQVSIDLPRWGVAFFSLESRR